MPGSRQALPEPGRILHHFSAARTDAYIIQAGGDRSAALDLYRWNTETTGAFWDTIGYLEVALRNTLDDRLSRRHARLRRTGSWLDDSTGELDANARLDIAKARSRVAAKGKAPSDGQTISELSFGFWRFLLARRYTNIWPDLAAGFPHAPNRSRTTVEAPVARLHTFRNRLAHHQRIWTEPLTDRYHDVLTLLGYLDPALRQWVERHSRIDAMLWICPTRRPYP
jgi:hypothetical protein